MTSAAATSVAATSLPTLSLRSFSPAPIAGEAGAFNQLSVGDADLLPNEKILRFVRHAEGHHNVHRDKIKLPFTHDARLTEFGEQQCAQLQRSTAALRPHLVVASPLTRTLQTATLCFDPQRCASGAPLVALEEVRETVNYCCDGRRPLSTIALEFPSVDFTSLEHDSDEIWDRYVRTLGPVERHGDVRETGDLPALAARARAAISWLWTRPEKDIIVVSHCAFLRHLFGFGHDKGTSGKLLTQPRCVEYADAATSLFMREWVTRAV